jgi:hypothetical protein
MPALRPTSPIAIFRPLNCPRVLPVSARKAHGMELSY